MEDNRNDIAQEEPTGPKGIIEEVNIDQEMRSAYIDYSMSVIVSRALPDARDGLKPVQRRVLYGMKELGLDFSGQTKKSARIVGEVLGKFHPHGDSSVYDAMARLAQNWNQRYPLVFGQGNFGSMDGDPVAAMRYTEAKLEKIAADVLGDMDKDTVDFQPNFDDSLEEPVVVPTKLPLLLLNGSAGIAVGMATNMAPHNLGECCDAICAYIDNPDIDIDELIRIIPAPDFPTGGIIMGRSAIKHAYRTGRGGIVLRGRAEIEETATGKQRIVITELPYQVNKAKFIIQVADMVKNKRIEGISDIKEESDRSGMRVVIDIKKDANAQVVLNMLYKHTLLQQGEGIIILALVDGAPKILNLKEVLECYLNHQIDVLTRKTRFDLGKAKEREHIVKGLVTALANIDEVIAIIKASEDKQDAMEKLTANFELDEIQANAILEMKLSRLTSLEVEKLNEELKDLDFKIADLEDILAKPERVKKIIRDNLEDVKNEYGEPRRTEISMDMGGIDIADLIEKEDVVISMTHLGYIKRMSTSEYHAQKRGGVGVTAHKTKDEDYVEQIFTTSSHDDLLFFTTKGKVYVIKAYEVPEAQRAAKGRSVVNLLPLDADEKVTTIIPRADDQKGNLIMATRNGLIKKTDLTEFERINKNGKIAISLVDNDVLIGAEMSDGNGQILIASKDGKCIRFSENDVRKTGRGSQGVKSMDLKEDDEIIDMTLVKEGSQIITITENGYGKRSPESDYRLQGRGGMGVKAGVLNDKTGRLVALKQTNGDEDILMIADNGVVIRTPVDSISQFSRMSQGVRVMKLREGAKLVSVALSAKEEETDVAETETAVEDENEE